MPFLLKNGSMFSSISEDTSIIQNRHKNHNCLKGFAGLQSIDYIPHKEGTVKQPAEVVQSL